MDDFKTKAAAPDQESAAFANTTTANHTAADSRLTDQKQTERDAKAIKSRSTSTESQLAKLVALLRQGPHTTYSLRKHGIAQTSTRIFDLRADGYEINTELVTAIDSDGFQHVRVARYSLVREKPQQGELPGVGDE